MIDIKKAEKAFKEYLKQYDLTDEKVTAKIEHTYGVVKEAEYLSNALNLNDEDTSLAKLIALLHDIGRFEQAKSGCKLYDEAEKNMDHAKYGVKILFEENLIRNFIEDNSYDNIIYKAIENHNKLEIEQGLSEKELLHAKIIRDCDKTENLIQNQTRDFGVFLGTNDMDILENDTISDVIYELFMDAKTMDIKQRKTYIDRWVSIIAFIFDYNFNESIKYLKDKNCINNLLDRIDFKNSQTKDRIAKMKEFVNKYIDERLK